MNFTPVTSNRLLARGTETLARNDDRFEQIDIGAVFEEGINIGGTTYDRVYVNNNGNLTFSSGLSTFTPGVIGNGRTDLVAAFWGDVDTRNEDSGLIYYRLDTQRDSLIVTWDSVGYYSQAADRTNSFQLELVDRGGGDLEVIFRYADIEWTTGNASGGSGGLGGTVARAGFSLGDTLFELPASGDQTAVLNLDRAVGNTGVAGVWQFLLDDGEIQGVGTDGNDRFVGTDGSDNYLGDLGDDILDGGLGDDFLLGGAGNDAVRGGEGNDYLSGGDGVDTVNGGPGNDTLAGGDTGSDLRDVFFGGTGDDYIDAGFGNDEVNGQDGNDTLLGGAGADTVVGGNGDDVITGSEFSDRLFGGDGMDFINGGFGSDRVTGGAGADQFFHVGVAGHGSDWIQDYSAAEGDVLVFGGQATRDQFQVNFATTAGAGDAAVDEAFVIFRPTGQILWALVDGAGQDEINLRLADGQVYDLVG